MFKRTPKPGTAHVYVDKKGEVTRIVTGPHKPGAGVAKLASRQGQKPKKK